MFDKSRNRARRDALRQAVVFDCSLATSLLGDPGYKTSNEYMSELIRLSGDAVAASYHPNMAKMFLLEYSESEVASHQSIG